MDQFLRLVFFFEERKKLNIQYLSSIPVRTGIECMLNITVVFFPFRLVPKNI